MSETSPRARHSFPRKFLVVVDKTPECRLALRFATRRAQHTGGRIALICVAEAGDPQQWRGLEAIQREEAHEEAENAIHAAAKYVNELSGLLPELIIEHGEPASCVMNLIKADTDISILVLGASASKDGPGPLVSLMLGSQTGSFPIPVTIVPGRLGDDEIDALA